MLTFSKVALSLSASTPQAPAAVPMMLKWDRSIGYSFSDAAVMIPNGWG